MSVFQQQPDVGVSVLETVIVPRTSDLVNGFKVRRVLPSVRRRMVGPFIFFDEMGPEILRAGNGLDVAPHPHIGLATITYLFEGELLHRDSLGTIQPIRPGEVNWMTAGKGIAHSERTPPEIRQTDSKLFGIQSWIALPQKAQETDPTFAHHEVRDLPVIDSSKERIEQAKEDWKAGRFSPVPEETELIPLPDSKPIVARYP